MKVEVTSTRKLEITPESQIEQIFIEDILGLKRDGDSVELVRVNAANLNALAYLETRKLSYHKGRKEGE